LLDFETPLWLDETAADAHSFFAFHCGAPMTSVPSDAAIAVIGRAADLDLNRFCIGTDEHPETATTLIVDVRKLLAGSGVQLEGPGIKHRAALYVEGVAECFWSQVAKNHLLFPSGVDLVLTAGKSVAGLPRSVRVIGGG
jgi:alpha-D-ribose 1-methylphosphonate 5-triphosphate synthase subunit PhnH